MHELAVRAHAAASNGGAVIVVVLREPREGGGRHARSDWWYGREEERRGGLTLQRKSGILGSCQRRSLRRCRRIRREVKSTTAKYVLGRAADGNVDGEIEKPPRACCSRTIAVVRNTLWPISCLETSALFTKVARTLPNKMSCTRWLPGKGHKQSSCGFECCVVC